MSWDVEPWQPAEMLEPVSSEPLVIDVEWQPVGNTKLTSGQNSRQREKILDKVIKAVLGR